MSSNKFRRHAPKDFTWQECVSLQRNKDVQEIVERLNSSEWKGSKTLEERAKEREEKRLAREEKKKEKAKLKTDQDAKKLNRALVKVVDLLRDQEVTLDVPRGSKKVTMRLVVDWQ